MAGTAVVNRSSVSALAFLAWDIVITFDDEVRVIWRQSWTPMKVLYFIIRYLSLLVQLSSLFTAGILIPSIRYTHFGCFIWQAYQGVGAILVILSTDVVLILRVHALYHGNKVIQRLLWVFYLGEAVSMVIGLKLTLDEMDWDDVCRVTTPAPMLSLVVGAAIAFQTILFVLTSIKFGIAVRAGWGHVPLVAILMRDGTWAFIVLFLVLAGALVLFVGNVGAYSCLLYGWLLTSVSACGYRVLLNMHDLSQPTPTGSTVGLSHHTSNELGVHFTTQFTEDTSVVSTQIPLPSEREVDEARTWSSRI
ncbi:hypothetical protein BDN72DRAFT_434883 [Pluteus cervinus]|uniref:Uncharacterized protein n=1 Tax=Pluteus cervinus TaxID=181527 RepID=A0ACD3A7H7_9AGAR|nr:hypothetical protein BDN72DRAFT_434883 [Pluteus cervinus]